MLRYIVVSIGHRIAVFSTILLWASSLVQAQSVSYGLCFGAPLNHLATADSGRVADTGRYTFGPALRLSLPHGFGFDLNLLYKQLKFGFDSNPDRITIHRLELTPLLRYVFSASRVRMFMHAGMSFNRVIDVSGADVCTDAAATVYCMEGKAVAQLRHSHTHGFVWGTGIDFRRGALRLAPEFRITRWVDRNFGTGDSPLRSNLTQIELLLGLTF